MGNTKKPICFMVRNRPQGADIIDLVIKEKRVFIGYPSYRRNMQEAVKNFKKALCDLSCSDDEWNEYIQIQGTPYKSQLSKNRNIVCEAIPGSIVVVPRPDRGVVYCGVVKKFELVDNPSWGEGYLKLREGQKLKKEPKWSHLQDVVQSWVVDEWIEVPMTKMPAWIRKSFFGRSTIARIHPISIGQQILVPFDTIKDIIKNPQQNFKKEISTEEDVKKRLLTDISPEVFEHLVVGILQLERPDQTWAHVGGSGDGGVDGLATNSNGGVSTIVQCKWKYDGGKVQFEKSNFEGHKILAALLHPKGIERNNSIEFLGIDEIADLIMKHADKLPWAISMKIKPQL